MPTEKEDPFVFVTNPIPSCDPRQVKVGVWPFIQFTEADDQQLEDSFKKNYAQEGGDEDWQLKSWLRRP